MNLKSRAELVQDRNFRYLMSALSLCVSGIFLYLNALLLSISFGSFSITYAIGIYISYRKKALDEYIKDQNMQEDETHTFIENLLFEMRKPSSKAMFIMFILLFGIIGIMHTVSSLGILK